jgi:integrase
MRTSASVVTVRIFGMMTSRGNWFRDRCDEARLYDYSAHGLRKGTPAVLAEMGATPHMIQSITGHCTLSEVENYTRAARQKILANAAMKLITNEATPTDTVGGSKTTNSA